MKNNLRNVNYILVLDNITVEKNDRVIRRFEWWRIHLKNVITIRYRMGRGTEWWNKADYRFFRSLSP